MTTNRHPIDELADVRAELKRLKAREAELRDVILAGGCELVGDQFEASVRETKSERIDVEALRREMGTKALAPYMRESTTCTIRVVERQVLEEAA